ncbi:MAG: DNA polymerase III subunit delta' [Rhodospirillaceae bacterium]|jgi:DNA polymerase III subunit delta'|nr:DNA polymerase III subunit delta' [Rhodospirillaceae bacterium]MBT4219666.1 DNA polymerase III subunit delta' [Rhodospirillaceae bacterium]MBT4465032.1 DNA polymerase III subunit delta' [Rhodospirillaceae bacterium]MBT5307738.1 DNA polymerase III subunit delta' [Rhodospirillaceae bacterium]MBT7355607.1 DNA polymerase III subunit delta' [Rhodospirillaceae bacterium]
MSPAKSSIVEDEDGPLPARANPDLQGHDAAEKSLLDAFNSGKLAHAWLLTGPKGIGKATLAYRFARHVLSTGDGEGGLFGDAAPVDSMYVSPDDPVFLRISAGGHADLKVIERAYDEKRGKWRTEIVVDDVRSLGRFLSLTSAEGGWRVVVIDSADEMNRNAANAVLKVLEEPPKRALLLLVSHNPGRLLPTIRSRCRKLTLKPLAESAVVKLLLGENPEMPMSDAEELARLSDGSIGRALNLEQVGGLALYHEMTAILERLPVLDIGAVHALAGKLGKAGADDAFHTFTELLTSWISKHIRDLSTRAANGDLESWLQVWDKVNHLLERTDAVNLDRRQTLITIFTILETA